MEGRGGRCESKSRPCVGGRPEAGPERYLPARRCRERSMSTLSRTLASHGLLSSALIGRPTSWSTAWRWGGPSPPPGGSSASTPSSCPGGRLGLRRARDAVGRPGSRPRPGSGTAGGAPALSPSTRRSTPLQPPLAPGRTLPRAPHRRPPAGAARSGGRVHLGAAGALSRPAGLAAYHLADETLALPNLRELMAEGVRTQNSQTVFPSVTQPSHTSIVTGVSPRVHGVMASHGG